LVERVLDPQRSNFCDWFQPASSPARQGQERAATPADADDLHRAAEDLFK
jgi:hypothetical protein